MAPWRRTRTSWVLLDGREDNAAPARARAQALDPTSIDRIFSGSARLSDQVSTACAATAIVVLFLLLLMLLLCHGAPRPSCVMAGRLVAGCAPPQAIVDFVRGLCAVSKEELDGR